MITFKNLPLIAIGVSFISLSSLAKSEALELKHNYDLNNSYADSLGGPSLVPNGGTLGATGYTFGANQGLTLSNAINPTDYSIGLIFSINNTGGYRKIIDFKNRTSDNGLYNLNSALSFYPVSSAINSNTILPSSIIGLVITRDGATNTVSTYINGLQDFSFVDSGNIATFSQTNNIINFFIDDTLTSTESSSGFVKQIRIWDGALTPSEGISNSSVAAVPFDYDQSIITGLTAILGFGSWMWRKSRKNRQKAVDVTVS